MQQASRVNPELGRLFRVVCLVGLFLRPGAAAAQSGEDPSFTFSGTETLEMQIDAFHEKQDADDPEPETHRHLRNLLDLFLTAGNMNIGTTIAFQNFYPVSPTVASGWESGIRKIFIEYQKPAYGFTAGDMFSALGRGLTLSVLKDDAILLDDSILGGRGFVKTGPFKITALGGYVQDEITAETDWIAGAEVKASLRQGLELGGVYSYVGDKNNIFVDGSIHTATANLRKSLFKGWLDFYGEGGFMTNRERETFGNGHGIYLATTLNLQPTWTMLVEFKDYYLFDNKYNNPPLIDEDDQTNDLEDIRGFRVKNDFSVSPIGTSFSVSYGMYTKVLKDLTGHQVAVLAEKYDLFDRVYLQAALAYRWDLFNTFQLTLESTVALSDRDSLEVHAVLREETAGFGTLKEDEFSMGFARSPLFSAHFLWQHATREVMGRNDFFGGEFNLFLTETLEFNLFAGQLKGGKVCSGGICRWEPPFQGFKFKTIYRF